MFAYVWLVIILTRITPNEVDWWEALLTFLFFPVLVVTAYCTDKHCFRHRRAGGGGGAQKAAAGIDDDDDDRGISDEKPDGNAETGFCKNSRIYLHDRASITIYNITFGTSQLDHKAQTNEH